MNTTSLTLQSASDLIVNNDTAIVADNTNLILTDADLLGNDIGSGLVITGLDNAVNGSVSFDSQGQIVFIPTNDFYGTSNNASFEYTVTDDMGISSTGIVFITVDSTNQAPIAVNDTASATENSSIIIPIATLLANDSDPENNPISLSSITEATNGQATLDDNGNIIFTPTADYVGNASFQYVIEDSRGGTSTANVTIRVNSSNQAPLAVNDSGTINQNTALTLTAAQLLANDSDPEGDQISLVSVTNPINGQVVRDSNGNITFTPNANYAGNASFQYTIRDTEGATSTATVNIIVNSVNRPPVAVNDSFSTRQNRLVSIPTSILLANDSDPDGNTLTFVSVSNATDGQVSYDGRSSVAFTPNTNFIGNATFQYTVKDSQGATSTGTATVYVFPYNNIAPIATNDVVSGFQDTRLTTAISTLLRNDSDLEGDPISLVSVGNAMNGQVALDGKGNVIFTPAANFVGTASYRYTIQDSFGATATANVTVNVTATRLTAMNDAVQAIVNRPRTIISSTLIANDRDPNKAVITIDGVSNPVNGSVAINSYGNVVFTPNSDYTGPASFNYTIRNSSGATATGQVAVNVGNLPKVAMGTNLAPVSDWSTQLPFIDFFKSSRPWFWEGPNTTITPTTTTTTTTATGTTTTTITNLDSNGWLSSITPPPNITLTTAKATTVLFSNMIGQYPTGSYVVLYDGEGTINYRLAARKNTTLSKPGRDVIDVNSSTSGGIYLQITSTNTNNYVRNIRVIPQEFENTYTSFYSQETFNPSTAKIFNPVFMNKTEPFSAVRFMDWMRTNGSSQVSWSTRPTLNQAQWGMAGGVPVEVMVALSNQGNFNPWFNMPHMANDDYVRNFATYVRDNLAPGRKVYVEYTNEAWNTLFSQTAWINNQAKISGLNATQWFARRTAQMVDIWKQVFGTQADRVVGVLATQAANIGLGNTAINYLKNTGQLSKIQAIAIAPYFGGYMGDPAYSTQVQALTVNQLFDELTQGGVIKNSTGTAAVPGGALEQSYSWMQNYASLARSNNLELLAYEGGQHLVGYKGVQDNNTIMNLFIAANRDPRMGILYQDYLAKWNQLGGGLFMNFNDISNPARSGSWGTLENLGYTPNANITNPKYGAIMEMTEAKP